MLDPFKTLLSRSQADYLTRRRVMRLPCSRIADVAKAAQWILSVVVVLLVLGDYDLLTLTAYNLTTVPPRLDIE